VRARAPIRPVPYEHRTRQRRARSLGPMCNRHRRSRTSTVLAIARSPCVCFIEASDAMRRVTLALGFVLFVLTVRTALGALASTGPLNARSRDLVAAWGPTHPPGADEIARPPYFHGSIAPAPVAERLPVLPPVQGRALRLLVKRTRSRGFEPTCAGVVRAQVRVHRHVPRMKCGDPPRA
jgi:hypothetical protein